MKALTLLEFCIGDGGCDGIRIRMPVTGDIYFFLSISSSFSITFIPDVMIIKQIGVNSYRKSFTFVNAAYIMDEYR